MQMNPLAHGPFAVDYEARIDWDGLRQARWQRAWAAMEAAGLDAVLVWKDENVRYLTCLRPQLIAGKSGLLNGALMKVGEPPTLLVSGGDRDRAADRMPWLKRVEPIPIIEERGLIDHFCANIAGPLLRDEGLLQARIGVDLASRYLFEQVQVRFDGIRWSDGDQALQQARRIKLPAELAVMEQASTISEAVTMTAIEAIAVGRREIDVAADAMAALYRLGGEYAHVVTPFVASGEHMSPPTRLATDKTIRWGDLVFIDIGAMWNGYFSDIGRTVICGEPSPQQRKIYRCVYESLEAGIAAMRPGATNYQVADAIISTVAEYGLREHLLSLFIGHGIGIGSNEPPYVGENFPGSEEVVLEEGMVFALEPLVWVPEVQGGGGVRLEDTVVVTATGARRISRLPYDSRLLA